MVINEKGQIELPDFNPMAIVLGGVGAVIAFIVASRTGTGIFWTITSTAAAGVVGYLVANRMAQNA